MYLNNASTKDVINTQNQCQIWIYLKTGMEQYGKGFHRFHAGEDVRPVTSCKFLLWRKCLQIHIELLKQQGDSLVSSDTEENNCRRFSTNSVIDLLTVYIFLV